MQFKTFIELACSLCGKSTVAVSRTPRANLIKDQAAMNSWVLIVDDEENLLVLLERVFQKNGFQVKAATNGYQALRLIGQHVFDLAVLDVQMFPVDGIMLLREVRKRSPSTSVIMIAAYPTSDARTECMKIGAAAFLAKPLDLNYLKDVAQRLAHPDQQQ